MAMDTRLSPPMEAMDSPMEAMDMTPNMLATKKLSMVTHLGENTKQVREKFPFISSNCLRHVLTF